jgi:hypothetical protein
MTRHARHAHACARTHTLTCAHTRARTQARTHALTCACTHTRARARTHIPHARTHSHVHTCVNALTCAYTCARTHTRARTCARRHQRGKQRAARQVSLVFSFLGHPLVSIAVGGAFALVILTMVGSVYWGMYSVSPRPKPTRSPDPPRRPARAANCYSREPHGSRHGPLRRRSTVRVVENSKALCWSIVIIIIRNIVKREAPLTPM